MSTEAQIIRKEYIYSGILAGAESVSKRRDLLNRANGFPVPDRDTGNNLSHLMHVILRDLKGADTIKKLLDDVSDLAISGARGNSGAIFSQFFCGFSSSAPQSNQMTIDELLRCFQGGYNYAYRAIGNPVEGTIITAIRSWVEALQQVVSRHINLLTIYQRAYPMFSETVRRTALTLRVQRQLKSADAGALAFLYFIEGFMAMLIDEVSDYRPQIAQLGELPSEVYHDAIDRQLVIAQRYCTEVLIAKGDRYQHSVIAARLAALGESVVISESAKLARLHVHTDYPADVVSCADQMGAILETKADDMVAQSRLTRRQTGKIALVIDSIADLPRERLNDDTYLLPINLLVGDVSYQDKITAVSEMITAGRASSAQPNIAQLKRFLEPICRAYDDVIVLTVSAEMSGLYQRFKTLIDDFKSAASIYLVDSKLNSVGEGLVVDYATQLIAAELTANKVVERLNGVIDRTKIFVSVPNLRAMVDSGRLNRRIGLFLQKINYLPLISINGAGQGMVTGLAFSKQKNLRLLRNKVLEVKDEIDNYAIVHCDNQTLAEQLAAELTAIVGRRPLYIAPISTVIKLFSGSGSVAVAYTLVKAEEAK